MFQCAIFGAALLATTACLGARAGTFEDDLPYLRGKWRGDVTDRSTGLGLQALKAEAQRIVDAEKDREPWCIVKAHLFETICDKMAVGFSAHSFRHTAKARGSSRTRS